jgi:cellobiose phosphorylase
VRPRVPRGWTDYSIAYRFGATEYRIRVELVQPGAADAATEVTVDGRPVHGASIALVDDGTPHEVVVRTTTAAG